MVITNNISISQLKFSTHSAPKAPSVLAWQLITWTQYFEYISIYNKTERKLTIILAQSSTSDSRHPLRNCP